ncbi:MULTISPECIES: hypothetical protein [unclassified Frigoribacterium]|jgi:hypothetical protein|uniref:hypothetical protein n=1 Tax=unclassified Frigoribacterium TaxID=2627005 RepID=UPI001902DA5C|nr:MULTISPECIES: hypothetical protein [unclassified Frigoribacterium]MBD8139876.1 hypothetical protein [Frigoribacterium sp. CFBP 13605]WAC50345.1 hypothetical protein OVA02_10620 [Frigoribacterium sp. SL97]
MKSEVTTTASVALLASGTAVLLCAAALAFQSGIIADSTGGVGGISPVEKVMWVTGLLLLGLGIVFVFIRPRQRT